MRLRTKAVAVGAALVSMLTFGSSAASAQSSAAVALSQAADPDYCAPREVCAYDGSRYSIKISTIGQSSLEDIRCNSGRVPGVMLDAEDRDKASSIRNKTDRLVRFYSYDGSGSRADEANYTWLRTLEPGDQYRWSDAGDNRGNNRLDLVSLCVLQ
jgi:hypothetical protein